MYYEKLESIFRKMKIEDLFSGVTIGSVDSFIRKTVKTGMIYHSPYKFALDNNITVNESVKLFMFLTGDDGLFDTLFYFECSRPSCHSSRVYFENINEMTLVCDECETVYELKTIKPYIKVLFKLKDGIVIPNTSRSVQKHDPNSTLQALEGLPDHLKFESPSSLNRNLESRLNVDEGDNLKGIDITLAIEENFDKNNNPINGAVEDFKQAFREINM
ncbi:hypothetical protein [Evansella tamaricis]|uniref:Uncharacterized protein n=1 Tax=Evansella tamaricis TaxID=2069301 RepID=A0ABS6JBU5_9BACI|nr:hypothetical protein [Evansella tamaricis]MBU9711041.1 hypothetical protein [Evansella tamaricis]